MVGEMATAADGMHPTGMHSCIDQSLTEFIRGFLILQSTDCTLITEVMVVYR